VSPGQASVPTRSWRCKSTAQALSQSLPQEGYEAALRTGDVDDPIPALLEVRDRHGNRVDILIGLRGMDRDLMNRTRQVWLAEAILEVVGREDFIAMKAYAGGPVDLADARAVIDLGWCAQPASASRRS
jgi:hypothetical protein